MENDTSSVFLAHLMPEILHFMFVKMADSAILDLEVKMVSKLYTNDPSRFVMPELLPIDNWFAILAHFVPQM